MASKLIELQDDILVETEVPGDQVEAISGGLADRVEASIDGIKDILLKTCKPVTEVWKELNKDMQVEQAEVVMGLGFEASGNLYLAKAKGNANLTVKLILKPKDGE
jgi:hypothetical protein